MTNPNDELVDDEKSLDARFLVRDLLARVRVLENKVDTIEKEVLAASLTLKQGTTGGAEKSFLEMKQLLHEMRQELTALQAKTTRWEGGGSALYVLITLLGGFIGWMISHFGGGVK